MISIDWIKSYIEGMIYVNTEKNEDERASIPAFREFPKITVSPREIVAPKLVLPDSSLSDTEKIISILTAKEVRRGSSSMLKPFIPEISENIGRLVKNKQPINFILPSLPFKDQSPFTTGVPINHTDLSEHAMFAQLKRILDAIASVYEPGGHFTLLCDGYVYADVFAQGDKDGAGRYKASCEKIKNTYDLHNQITLFDMREVFFDMPEWPDIKHEIESSVNKLYQENTEIKNRIDVLAKRFIYHVALPAPYFSYENAREVYQQNPWPEWLQELLTRSAIEYIVLHLTLAHTKLTQRAFPSAIRCTVHPKPAAQLPLHLTNQQNSLLPYNGIAAIMNNEEENLFSSLRVMRLSDVLGYTNVEANYLEDDKYPFFYRIRAN